MPLLQHLGGSWGGWSIPNSHFQSSTSTQAPTAGVELSWVWAADKGCSRHPCIVFRAPWNGPWKEFILWAKAAMHTRNSSRPWHPRFLCTKVSYTIPVRTLQVKWSFSSSSFMLGSCANWLLREFVLLTMLVIGWGFLHEDCLEDGDEVQV